MIEPRLHRILLLAALAAGGRMVSAQALDSVFPPSLETTELPAADSVVDLPAPLVQEADSGARDPVPPAPHLPAPVAPGRRTAVAGAKARHPASRSSEVARKGPWTLLLDLADLDGGGRLNQRHLHGRSKRTNLCCVDLAWMPLRVSDGTSAGLTVNAGWWSQSFPDGPAVSVTDLLLAGSWEIPLGGSGLWSRLDFGISTLVVARRRTGVDWGAGGAARLGWRFPLGRSAVVAGAGFDFRNYTHLVMKDIPAVTFFTGVEL